MRTAGTLRPEGFATHVTLVGLLATVDTQMHVEVVLLGERMVTYVAYKRTLISVEHKKRKKRLRQSVQMLSVVNR